MKRFILLLVASVLLTSDSFSQAFSGELGVGPSEGVLFFSGTFNFEGAIVDGEMMDFTARAGIGPVLTQNLKAEIHVPVGLGINYGETAHRFEICVNYILGGTEELFNGTVGYRYQKQDGILFRVFYVQYFTADMIVPYFGIGIGKAFY